MLTDATKPKTPQELITIIHGKREGRDGTIESLERRVGCSSDSI